MRRNLLDQLLLISHLLQRDMKRAFAGTSLTEARLGVLWVLQTQGPSTQQAIAAALEVSARNISALVDALEATGHVRRTPHATDRRAVLVELTPASTDLMDAMQREHAAAAAALLASVDPDDRDAFERGIDAVVARLGEMVAAAEADAGAGPPEGSA